MDESVRAVLVELVQDEGEAFYADAARVESQLLQRVPDHPAEIAVLATAVRAGVVNELRDVKPGLLGIAEGHLASRMVRLHDADPTAARWAVESWAHALGASREPPPPVLAVDRGPTDPYPPPERDEDRWWSSIPWPWVAVAAAGVLGVIAGIVLLRLIVGLASSDGGEGTTPATTPTSTVTTLATPAAALTVPPRLTLGTGDVQVTLLWADGNDLDLHVIDPSGAEIYFSNPKSPTGGTLDHDDTAGCNSTGTHVENVFWPTGGAPRGRYQVFVKNYTSCGAPSRYSLRATTTRGVATSSTGTVGAHEGDQTPVSEFSFS